MNEQVYWGTGTPGLWKSWFNGFSASPPLAGPVNASQYHASHRDLGESGCRGNDRQRWTSGPDGWRQPGSDPVPGGKPAAEPGLKHS